VHDIASFPGHTAWGGYAQYYTGIRMHLRGHKFRYPLRNATEPLGDAAAPLFFEVHEWLEF